MATQICLCLFIGKGEDTGRVLWWENKGHGGNSCFWDGSQCLEGSLRHPHHIATQLGRLCPAGKTLFLSLSSKVQVQTFTREARLNETKQHLVLLVAETHMQKAVLSQMVSIWTILALSILRM